MNFAGIIFADTYGVDLDDLLLKRALAAVPFGGRYRLIDFSLSNLVNAGVKDVGIIVKKNYQSLMGHVRSGSVWDLDRKTSQLTILPPLANIGGADEDVYRNRLEGLIANRSFIRHLPEDYVILSGCGCIANVDFQKALEFHVASGARVTCLVSQNVRNMKTDMEHSWLRVNVDGRIEEQRFVEEQPKNFYPSLNTYIFSRKDLVEIIESAATGQQDSMRKDVLVPMIAEREIYAYAVDGPVLWIEDVPGYLKSSLALLDLGIRNALFNNENAPIITKVKDSAPTKYGKNAHPVNSLIADGAFVDGTVRNCVVFRGAKIEKGAVVENSVIMQDSVVSQGARLSYCVLDKNVFIEPDRILSGYITRPFVLERGTRI